MPDLIGDLVRTRIRESVATKERLLADELVELIAQAGSLVADAYGRGGKVLLFGNGGSAADAQHIAAELVGRFRRDRPALPAIALASNTSIVTAVANDYDFADIFARQVEAFGEAGDVAIAISTSGSSPNVLKAIDTAQSTGLRTIALSGGDGGLLGGSADVCLVVPEYETARIQEAHILVGHIICELVELKLFAP